MRKLIWFATILKLPLMVLELVPTMRAHVTKMCLTSRLPLNKSRLLPLLCSLTPPLLQGKPILLICLLLLSGQHAEDPELQELLQCCIGLVSSLVSNFLPGKLLTNSP